MPTVQVRFAPPLHERFIAECEKREVSPSEFIRRAVEAMMDHIDSDPPRRPMSRDELAAEIISQPTRVNYVPKVRGFAADGSGEITRDQALKNRDGILSRKKGK